MKQNQFFIMHGNSFFYTEILNCLNSSSLSNALHEGGIKKVQDPLTASPVLVIRNGKLRIPKSEKGLGLKNHYLTIQGYFFTPKDYTIQILVTLKDQSKKKLYITNISEIKISENYAVIPNSIIHCEK